MTVAKANPAKRGSKPNPDGRMQQMSVRAGKEDFRRLQDIAVLYGTSLSEAAIRSVRTAHMLLSDSDKAALVAIRKARGTV